LKRIKLIISKHHSRDHQFIAAIQKAMDMEEDEGAEYFPWRCPCGRINKKYALTCAICHGYWTAGTRHRTQPKAYTQESEWKTSTWEEWEDWENWEKGSHASSRASSRHHYGQPGPSTSYRTDQQPHVKGKGGRKGKNKGKNQGKQQQDMVSPFQREGANFAPWPSWDSSKFMPSSELAPIPFASMTAVGTQPEQEWVEHLRKAYPDPATMPEETKLLIERADKESGRLGIKNLHQATKYLGKAKKHLAEVTDHRRAHRALWMSHLSAGIQLWEKQLDEYRTHQALLTDQAGKARAEITATNQVIQQLSSRAAGGSQAAPAPALASTEEDTVEDAADKEEDLLRQKLQGVLKSCANSLGLDVDSQKPIEVAEEEEEKEEEDKRKRPRALEPFAPSAMKS
jgi:uncharacterized short protein YbdD (DUF466 family)